MSLNAKLDKVMGLLVQLEVFLSSCVLFITAKSIGHLKKTVFPEHSTFRKVYVNYRILRKEKKANLKIKRRILKEEAASNWRTNLHSDLSAQGENQTALNYLVQTDMRPHLGSHSKILILALAHLGDFVLSLRAMEIISKGFPQARITLVCAPACAQLAKKVGLFVDVKLFQFFNPLNRDWRGASAETYESFRNLDLGHFDIAIDLRHDADTRPCLYRVDAAFRAGFAAAAETNLPHLDLMLPSVELVNITNSDVRYSMHAERRLQLLASAVVNEFQTNKNVIERLVGTDRPSIGRRAIISMSAGDPIRYWPIADYAEVALHLALEQGMEIIVLGGGAERSLCEELVAQLPPGLAQAKCDVAIGDLPDLLTTATIVIGNGTGITHISSLLEVPTITILTGVTPVAVWRPIGGRTVTLTKFTPCSPCGLRESSGCPFDVTCQRSVRPTNVISAINVLLSENFVSTNSGLPIIGSTEITIPSK